ncbi:hypothetical protein [Candidatus Electronema sp. PJ]|uniref:hypothetical protein n=1 Tax=Candidatus Electronema sp. PJ TaxID=3401572 RepID=UPI003AA87265
MQLGLIIILAEVLGPDWGEVREEYGWFVKEFGSARKELYLAEKEFGLAKLLS